MLPLASEKDQMLKIIPRLSSIHLQKNPPSIIFTGENLPLSLTAIWKNLQQLASCVVVVMHNICLR